MARIDFIDAGLPPPTSGCSPSYQKQENQRRHSLFFLMGPDVTCMSGWRATFAIKYKTMNSIYFTYVMLCNLTP